MRMVREPLHHRPNFVEHHLPLESVGTRPPPFTSSHASGGARSGGRNQSALNSIMSRKRLASSVCCMAPGTTEHRALQTVLLLAVHLRSTHLLILTFRWWSTRLLPLLQLFRKLGLSRNALTSILLLHLDLVLVAGTRTAVAPPSSCPLRQFGLTPPACVFVSNAW